MFYHIMFPNNNRVWAEKMDVNSINIKLSLFKFAWWLNVAMTFVKV